MIAKKKILDRVSSVQKQVSAEVKRLEGAHHTDPETDKVWKVVDMEKLGL